MLLGLKLVAPDDSIRSALVAAAVAAVAGAALHGAITRIYATLIVETFGGQLGRPGSGAIDEVLAIVMTLTAAAVVGFYSSRRPGPGALLLGCQLSFVVIPLQALVSAGYVYAKPEFGAAVGLALILATIVAASIPAVQVSTRSTPAAVVAAVLVAMTVYTYVWLLVGGGFGRLNFDLSKVYDFRAEFLEHAAFPLSGYLISWQGYVLNPAIVIVGIRVRVWSLVLLGLVLELALFGMTNFRAFLFIPPLLLVFGWAGGQRLLPALLMAGAIVVVVAGLLLFAITGETLVPSLMIDRLLVIPAEIHYWYYDYFHAQGHSFLLLTQSILGSLGAPPAEPIAETIGWAYLGSNASANVGVFGDAFANFGVPGCMVFAVLFGLLIRCVESLGVGLASSHVAALLAAPALALVNSGLLTTLATHGLALALVVVWLLRAVPAQRAASSAA